MSAWNHGWVGAAAAVAGAVFVFTASNLWSRWWGGAAIRRWAGEQGFTVVHSARCSFLPHWDGTSGKALQCFRIGVRDNGGLVRWACARCFALGRTHPGSVEVIWDDC
jgi:hypothetical protein